MADKEMAHEMDLLFTQHMAYLTQQLSDRQITISAWQDAMRLDIRRAFALQRLAGADGDLSAIRPEDWQALDSRLRDQYSYLAQFRHGIESGEVDPAIASSRAEMYAKAAGSEYSRQVTAEVNLPAHPKDGSTACLSNCGCQWRDNGDGSWSWIRSLEDSCEDCKRREIEWANYMPEAA